MGFKALRYRLQDATLTLGDILPPLVSFKMTSSFVDPILQDFTIKVLPDTKEELHQT